MKKLRIIAAAVAAALCTTITPAEAGPIGNHFSAYDITQGIYYNCTTDSCLIRAPYVTANSYYNALANAKTALYHYPDNIYSTGATTVTVVPGQTVGLMCWLQSSTGQYWEKTDSRHVINGVSSLWIGYIDDYFLNISHAELFQYVPHC